MKKERKKLIERMAAYETSFDKFHKRMKRDTTVRGIELIRVTNKMYYETMKEMQTKLDVLNNLGYGI